MDKLDQLSETIAAHAAAHGLIVCRDDIMLDVDHSPTVLFESWKDLVELAIKMDAKLLYIATFGADAEESWQRATKRAGLYEDVNFTDDTDERRPAYRQREQWLVEQLNELRASIQQREDDAVTLKAIWMRDGVAHVYFEQADWWEEQEEYIGKLIEELTDVRDEARILRSDEESAIIKECAETLVHHERFSEATNENKREYMAAQLFPDQSPLAIRNIISLAQAIYWWDIEPAERATKGERIRELRSLGFSIRHIASMLRMPESQVREALVE